MSILISAVFMMAGFWFGVQYDVDKDEAIRLRLPIKIWKLWTAVTLMIASFLIFWFGS